MPAKFELIAPCFFGCESTAKFELTRIGAENIRVEDGRLSFAGGADMIAAANLNLRTVERVMLLLARYRAATFDDLFDGVYDIPWEELLPADAAFPVTGSSLNSQLSSVPACQSIIKKAVVKRLMAKHHTSVLPETGAETSSGQKPLSAFAALTAFQQMRHASSSVVSSITEVSLCYELQSTTAAPMALVPSWRIVTDTATFYVNCISGTVRRA